MIMIINGSMRPLQDQFMQGAPKETPKRRQMLAFTKVGDLLSKPSDAVGVIMNTNLGLVEHSVVCKISFIKCVAFSGLLREDSQGSNRSGRT